MFIVLYYMLIRHWHLQSHPKDSSTLNFPLLSVCDNQSCVSQAVLSDLRTSHFSALQTVKQMWPYISQFVEKLFRETIEPAVKGANAHLSTFSFTKIDLGDKVSRGIAVP